MDIRIKMKAGELKAAKEAYKKAANKAWREVIENVWSDLYYLTPIDTGLLRNSYLLGFGRRKSDPKWRDVSQTKPENVGARLVANEARILSLVYLTNYQPYQTILDDFYYPDYFYQAATREAKRHRIGGAR